MPVVVVMMTLAVFAPLSLTQEDGPPGVNATLLGTVSITFTLPAAVFAA
ncbi:hypothetical protein ACH4E7_38655 [Kitasatospora sp. NPDC018058]